MFDGVHRGHREILKAAVRKAHSIKGTSVVLTFWPHPQKEESLYSLKHRLRLIEELGIDVSIVIYFNQEFASISALNFVQDILVKKIGAHYLYVGKNFRFGKNAAGDYRALEGLSSVYDFKLKVFAVIRSHNKPISSTYIRALIKKGDLSTAQNLLCHPVAVLGTVTKGARLGRRLGFPTANINPHHEVLPLSGVYAVRIIFNQRELKGICYIGTKPTLKVQGRRQEAGGGKEKYVEVYIFNFKKNIYGKYLEIQFVKRIRGERKFASIQALAEQVKKDISLVKRLFSCH